jgi:hypothetical protein
LALALRLAINAGLTAPFGTTILGWIAVTQIRRSVGRLYGLKLAVFDGLLFPVLALDGAVASVFFAGGLIASDILAESGYGGSLLVKATQMLVVAAGAGLSIWLDLLIIRRVWRSVSLPATPPLLSTGSASRRGGPGWRAALASGVALLVLFAVAGIVALSSRHSTVDAPKDLAPWPDKLKSRPTAQVIQAGLAEPELPWAWMELERRAKAGRFDSSEAQTLLDGLTAWMRREYPHGYNQPLHWMGGILGELGKPGMVRDAQVLAFLNAFYGDPFLDQLPRLREGDSNLHLVCHWGDLWHSKPFGWDLLNEMRSITIDGQAIEGFRGYPKDRGFVQFNADLRLPALPPGKHLVKCEIESALVPESDMTGLANDAAVADWPSAKRRWTRTVQAELAIYPQDAEIVGLTNDPALYPLTSGALSTARVVLHRKGDGATATVIVSTSDKPPISFDVTLRINGQTYECGSVLSIPIKNGRVGGPNGASADIDPVDPRIKTAEVVLTPNSHAAEPYSGVDWIWGKEIVLPNVPLTRLDLPGTTPNSSQ